MLCYSLAKKDHCGYNVLIFAFLLNWQQTPVGCNFHPTPKIPAIAIPAIARHAVYAIARHKHGMLKRYHCFSISASRQQKVFCELQHLSCIPPPSSFGASGPQHYEKSLLCRIELFQLRAIQLRSTRKFFSVDQECRPTHCTFRPSNTIQQQRMPILQKMDEREPRK